MKKIKIFEIVTYEDSDIRIDNRKYYVKSNCKFHNYTFIIDNFDNIFKYAMLSFNFSDGTFVKNSFSNVEDFINFYNIIKEDSIGGGYTKKIDITIYDEYDYKNNIPIVSYNKNDIINKINEKECSTWIVRRNMGFSGCDDISIRNLNDAYYYLTEYINNVKFIIKRHKLYKHFLIIGYFLSLISIFTLPFLFGFIEGFKDSLWLHGFMFPDIFTDAFSDGVTYILLSSYLFFITVPLSLLYTIIGHPIVTKSIFFHNPSKEWNPWIRKAPINYKYIYCDSIAGIENVSSKNVKDYSSSIAASSIINHFIDKL